jgi:hypothetical protein
MVLMNGDPYHHEFGVRFVSFHLAPIKGHENHPVVGMKCLGALEFRVVREMRAGNPVISRTVVPGRSHVAVAPDSRNKEGAAAGPAGYSFSARSELLINRR